MSFATSLVFGIISICLGGITGSVLCILSGVLFKKKYLKSHFTIICVLLSVAVAFGTGGFVLIENLLQQISLIGQWWMFFLALFCAGVLSACFWKIALPVFVFAYILVSLVTGIKLYSQFGSKLDSVSVTVRNDSIKVQEDCFYMDDINHKSLVVEVYTIPGILIIPLPRVWYSVIGVISSDVEIDKTSDVRGLHEFSGIHAELEFGEKSDLLWQKQIDTFMKWVLQNRKNLLIEVPVDENLPAVYTLTFNVKGENLTCKIDKQL